MTKLVKYKEMAKSYAKKKDAQATDLQTQLDEERAKVAHLEEKITALHARGGLDSEGKDLAAELRFARAQLAEDAQQRAALDELRAAVTRAERESERENQRLAGELQRVRAELRAREEEMQAAEEEEAARRQQQEDREEEIEQLRKDWCQAQRDLRAAREETSDVRMETVGLRKELREARTEIRRLNRGGRPRKEKEDEIGDGDADDRTTATDAGPVIFEDERPARDTRAHAVQKPAKSSLTTTAQIASALGTTAANRALLDLSLNISGVSVEDGLQSPSTLHRHRPGDDSIRLTLTRPLDWESTLMVGKRHIMNGEKDSNDENSLAAIRRMGEKSYIPVPTRWKSVPIIGEEDSGTYELPTPLPARTSIQTPRKALYDITAGLNGTDVESTMDIGMGKKKGLAGLTPERREGAKRRLEAKRSTTVKGRFR